MAREIEAAVQMKLYTMTKRKLAGVFIIFFLCFSLSVVVGLLGPQVVYTDAHEEELMTNVYGAKMFSITTGMELNSLNQQLWLLATPSARPVENDTSMEGEVTPTLHLFYLDDEGVERPIMYKPGPDHKRVISCSEQCNTLLLFHLGYIDKLSYKVTVQLEGLDRIGLFDSVLFEFKTYKSAFTQLEIWFRAFFLALTFVVTIVYTRSLRIYHWKDWSIEQKWMMWLLPLLLLYNNPLFALAFLLSSAVPPVVDGIFQAFFLSSLLLFWLCIYHSIRQPKRTFCKFYLPKLMLVGLIWLSAIVLATWQAINERTDPGYNYKVDTVNFTGFKVLLLILASLYTLYLLYLLIRDFIELRNVAYFDLRLKFTAVFMMIVFSISLAILVLRFGTGILDENFVSDISTHYGSSAEFLTFYGLLNFYIYTMAFVYSPSKNAMNESRLHDNPVITMLTDSDEDVMYGSADETAYRPLSRNTFMNKFDADSD
ncbi:transmembrane protein 181-like isoform X2 [Watersipora subatra]|uniref:transmembrane protein 181-like isoform X2 n=1 Tax=Watersipora subatra TaxID=2589382 RepID=UPI00355AF600